MRSGVYTRGFTLLELIISISIFTLVMFVIFSGMNLAFDTMKLDAKMESAEGGATMLIDRMGMDIRESSYAYLFAGDWYAYRDAGGVTIKVARNYFSVNPLYGGTTLVPGISNENCVQCPNAACGWSNRLGVDGYEPNTPMAFLVRPIRNNPQSGAPVYPPPSLNFSPVDARGRLFGELAPGSACPFCGSTLEQEAYFSGLCLFSPRKADGSFSYQAGGGEAQWESMVFYCPFYPNPGESEIRRYAFYASQVNPNAHLADLLDLDGNGIIESPPMTDQDGNFVLDAEGEVFALQSSSSGNKLLYTRWDNAAGRSFRIEVNRATGMADVTVVGGPYGGGGTVQMRLKTDRYARGLSDFEAGTFINNPSWESGGSFINPTGVVELGAVRITFQVDRWEGSPPRLLETVHTLMFRPRN